MSDAEEPPTEKNPPAQRRCVASGGNPSDATPGSEEQKPFDRQASEGYPFDRQASEGRSFDNRASEGNPFDAWWSEGQLRWSASDGQSFDSQASEGHAFDRWWTEGQPSDNWWPVLQFQTSTTSEDRLTVLEGMMMDVRNDLQARCMTA